MKPKNVLKVSPSQARRDRETLTIGELQFEGVNDFIYLGANINSENKVDEEITRRITAGNHAYIFFNSSTVPWGPRPPHFFFEASRSHFSTHHTR
jgi:hypothetical protein